jgi:uncharacterized protein YerC
VYTIDMVRVSKHILNEKIRDVLVERLLRVMTGSRGGSRAVALQELLSLEEQIQFAKRLAIVVLLAHGVSVRAIAQALGVSVSTVSHHKMLLQTGHYANIVRRATASKRVSEGVARFVSDFLEIALMPYCGEGRKRVWQKYLGGGACRTLG